MRKHTLHISRSLKECKTNYSNIFECTMYEMHAHEFRSERNNRVRDDRTCKQSIPQKNQVDRQFNGNVEQAAFGCKPTNV